MTKNSIFKIVVISIGACFNLSAKILIFTYAFNRPDFIEMQHKTFQKFLKDEYEFVVFNDATNPVLYSQIEQMCAKYNIECIRIPQEIHLHPNHPSFRNTAVVNYSLKVRGFKHDGILALIDSDLFLVKEFSITDSVNGYDIVAAKSWRGERNYLWIGLVFLDMRTLPNITTIDFDVELANNLDAGGKTYYYLQNNPSVRLKWLNQIALTEDDNYKEYYTAFSILCNGCHRARNFQCNHNTSRLFDLGFDKNQIAFIQGGPQQVEFYCDNAFLHYRAGTNWLQKPEWYVQHKKNLLDSYMSAILS